MTIKDYSFLINHLKINISQKKYFFDIFITQKNKQFLKLLLKIGVLKRYLKINTSLFRIFPNWVNEKSLIKKIKFFQKKTYINISLKTLKIISKYTFNSKIILHTSKGLITHHEAIRYSIGGQLLCIIL